MLISRDLRLNSVDLWFWIFATLFLFWSKAFNKGYEFGVVDVCSSSKIGVGYGVVKKDTYKLL